MIVLEFAEGGSLLAALRGGIGVNEAMCLVQVADALNYLHSRNVVHRDIAARNVLLKDHMGRVFALADFGCKEGSFNYDCFVIHLVSRYFAESCAYYKQRNITALPFRWAL